MTRQPDILMEATPDDIAIMTRASERAADTRERNLRRINATEARILAMMEEDHERRVAEARARFQAERDAVLFDAESQSGAALSLVEARIARRRAQAAGGLAPAFLCDSRSFERAARKALNA